MNDTTAPPARPPRPHRPRGPRAAVLGALAVVLALVTGCAAQAPGPAPAPPVPAPSTARLDKADVDAWLDGLVPAGLERAGIAGAAVTVVRDGRVLTSRGFGYADTGGDGSAPRPVDPADTLFRVGSVSKVFTATAVLQLAAQGRIDLDADVRRYLDFPLPLRFDTPVTMRHLLTHTAGFEERVRGLIQLGDGTENLRDTVSVDPPEQVFAPGTVPSYSNYSYGLAGYVVQRVAGMPFAQYVERNLLARAGMTSSTFAQPLPAALRARLSSAYPTDDGPAGPFETVRPAPAGSLAASAEDMGRFMLALLGEPGAEPLLDPATRALMQQPALGPDTLGTMAGGPRMALGLFDESRGGPRILGHGGDTTYFHSHMQIYPQERTGVFVSTNSAGRGATDSLELREALTSGFADRYFPARATVPRAPTVSAVSTVDSTARAAMAEGTYEDARRPFSTFLSSMGLVAGQTRVTARPDGTILVVPGPVSAHPAVYREVGPWVWQEDGGSRRIAMRSDGERVVDIGYESAFTLQRVGPLRDIGVAMPVLVSSVAVLLVALLAWPAGALVRRRYAVPARAGHGRVDGAARLLTRIATACAVLAVAGWATAVIVISGLQDVPAPALHVLQGLQWVALAGLIPAAVGVVTAVRSRIGTGAVLRRLLVLLALVGIAWIAHGFALLAPSVTY